MLQTLTFANISPVDGKNTVHIADIGVLQLLSNVMVRARIDELVMRSVRDNLGIAETADMLQMLINDDFSRV